MKVTAADPAVEDPGKPGLHLGLFDRRVFTISPSLRSCASRAQPPLNAFANAANAAYQLYQSTRAFEQARAAIARRLER